MAAKVGNVDQLAQICKQIPQKLMLELFGVKKGNSLKDFQKHWDCPLGNAHVDLFEVFRWLREFFHENGPLLDAILEDGDEADLGLGAQYLRAKIDKTREDARLAKLKRELKEGTLCERSVIHTQLSRLADRIRTVGEKAQRQFGRDGYNLFHQLETGFRNDLDRMIQADNESEPTDKTEVAEPPTKKSKLNGKRAK